MTAVPAPTLGPTGYVAPAESALRDGFFTDIDNAFGGGLNPDPSTSQGQLAVSLAAVMGIVDDLFLYYTNQVDPAFASDRMQDAIARIYYLTRIASAPTVVTATLTGAFGTIIPAGSLARAADGTLYTSTGVVTIPSGGTIDTEFAAVVDGPTACPAGALNTIVKAVPGWDTITNAADGTIGRDVETRDAFETRRALSVSGNAVGLLAAVRAAVLAVPGILDVFVTENSTAGSVAVGAVTLPPHSLYVAALGGTDADVARAIWTKKAPGCDYYGGNTTVAVQDTSYPLPYPTYNVSFERPASLPVFFDVTIATSSAVPADAETQVKNAIIAAFNGQDGGAPATIGATIYASRYYQPVAMLGAWARIVSLKVGLTTPGALDDTPVDIDKTPTITAAHITVTIA
jgi:uncharacterized phage protein gp47/JayE